MITNLKKTNKKDDMKLLLWIIAGFLFAAWLCTPPGNKFLQMAFWGNNTKFLIAKLTNNYASTEYIFHRNNAVYLAKMYQKKDKALKEMNKAIETLPSFASETELNTLYKERRRKDDEKVDESRSGGCRSVHAGVHRGVGGGKPQRHADALKHPAA